MQSRNDQASAAKYMARMLLKDVHRAELTRMIPRFEELKVAIAETEDENTRLKAVLDEARSDFQGSLLPGADELQTCCSAAKEAELSICEVLKAYRDVARDARTRVHDVLPHRKIPRGASQYGSTYQRFRRSEIK